MPENPQLQAPRRRTACKEEFVSVPASPRSENAIAVPWYLDSVYWWAYVDPRAITIFERQWLVNVILWGNFGRLRDAALDALADVPGDPLPGRTLQVACVYGDLTRRLAQRIAPGGSLEVVDVLPLQLANLHRKLPDDHAVRLTHGDSTALDHTPASFDRALLFFLLHEQPAAARRATLAQALRVVRPGGRVVIVDYHRPHALNPLYWPMVGILRTLEPFALDLWAHEIEEWLPADRRGVALERRLLFGGLYQLVTLTV
jgi:ubiquinone/menaquinone biosynthesis C-methylase UbiE